MKSYDIYVINRRSVWRGRGGTGAGVQVRHREDQRRPHHFAEVYARGSGRADREGRQLSRRQKRSHI